MRRIGRPGALALSLALHGVLLGAALVAWSRRAVQVVPEGEAGPTLAAEWAPATASDVDETEETLAEPLDAVPVPQLEETPTIEEPRPPVEALSFEWLDEEALEATPALEPTTPWAPSRPRATAGRPPTAPTVPTTPSVEPPVAREAPPVVAPARTTPRSAPARRPLPGRGGVQPVHAPDPPPPAGPRPRLRATVHVLLTVEADGAIRSAAVHASSGRADLDEHARAWAAADWTYPATGRAFRTVVPFHFDP